MHLSEADLIWNRAAFQDGGQSPREGDRALAALLLAHGLVMNGGAHHAIEVLSGAELAAAVAGYRFLSLADVALLFEDVAQGESIDEHAADASYARLVPSDATLHHRFRGLHASHPETFAPIDPSGPDNPPMQPTGSGGG